MHQDASRVVKGRQLVFGLRADCGAEPHLEYFPSLVALRFRCWGTLAPLSQMIYSSLLKNNTEAGGRLDSLRVSAGQETDEVP